MTTIIVAIVTVAMTIPAIVAVTVATVITVTVSIAAIIAVAMTVMTIVMSVVGLLGVSVTAAMPVALRGGRHSGNRDHTASQKRHAEEFQRLHSENLPVWAPTHMDKQ